jgi:hypothetical protein
MMQDLEQGAGILDAGEGDEMIAGLEDGIAMGDDDTAVSLN